MFARRGLAAGELERALRCFERPGIDRGNLDGDAEAGDARSREPGHGRDRTLAEHEHVETVGAGDQRVRFLADTVDDAVAGADLVRLAVLPREAAACEHEEDLLLGDLDVHWRRLLCRGHARASHADLDGAGGLTEIPAFVLDGPLGLARRLELVPVRDHLSSNEMWSAAIITPALLNHSPLLRG